MGETEIDRDESGAAKIGRRPTITVPPRAPFESLFTGGTMPGYSPGPMTLLSNIFSPDSNSCSFSQLLAGAMNSPLAKTGFLAAGDYNGSRDASVGDGNDKGSGYKQNRPMGLMVAQSPLFMVPPGLSPSGFLNSPGFLSPLQSPFGMSHQQALAHVTAQAALSQSFVQSQGGFQSSAAPPTTVPAAEFPKSSPPNDNLQPQVHTLQMQADPQPLKVSPPEASQMDTKSVPVGFDKPGSDGYNWRKYGQKIVKSKEHPRSYYKCTHPDCPVKKKVEHGSDGQVTEITYKGQHNHDKPPPNTRSKDGSGPEGSAGSRVKPEIGLQGRTEMDISTQAASSQAVTLTSAAPTQRSFDQLPLAVVHEERENTAGPVDEDNEDEPKAKRRNIEVEARLPAPSHQTITEPKIVVQTRSEVDLLDDGYKWRKYGQKVVKGNPHPRSYYRCTFAGCNVRKHVERASADPKAVITTYEGKHNHEIPSARNNNANSSGQLKPQKVVARKPSVHREVDFDSKGQIPVLTQALS
ncbi:OLC1v1009656C1 [Oldenlandia corymbosa var. corymbosa]|uniref:OLC1v1009656C1 n=1 Tax=Oldenlandia corymbosa var. corymbosa TaxID=529605 RepID=A0AAV1DPE5_OLDCO|nr:OLC1v1009656C1 [Oldenlandia corymbosa var. corymbosa]